MQRIDPQQQAINVPFYVSRLENTIAQPDDSPHLSFDVVEVGNNIEVVHAEPIPFRYQENIIIDEKTKMLKGKERETSIRNLSDKLRKIRDLDQKERTQALLGIDEKLAEGTLFYTRYTSPDSYPKHLSQNWLESILPENRWSSPISQRADNLAYEDIIAAHILWGDGTLQHAGPERTCYKKPIDSFVSFEKEKLATITSVVEHWRTIRAKMAGFEYSGSAPMMATYIHLPEGERFFGGFYNTHYTQTIERPKKPVSTEFPSIGCSYVTKINSQKWLSDQNREGRAKANEKLGKQGFPYLQRYQVDGLVFNLSRDYIFVGEKGTDQYTLFGGESIFSYLTCRSAFDDNPTLARELLSTFSGKSYNNFWCGKIDDNHLRTIGSSIDSYNKTEE